MMPEWWTYGLSDFLMFSPRVYYRLLAAYNADLWPAQIGTMLLGLAAAVLMVVPMRGGEKLIPAALGVLWMVVAWAFFIERWATINWGALYVAPAFVLQGALMIGLGLAGALRFRTPRDGVLVAAAVLVAAIVLGWPLLAPLSGRPLDTAEVFGLFPDPTALATLAVLTAGRGSQCLLLMIVPVAWALVSAATLFTLGAWTWMLVPAVAAVSIAIAIAPALSRPRPPSSPRS